MFIFETKFIDIIERTPNVKSFRFEVKDDISFKPGQFFLVTIKINGNEATKPFSFSSSPTERGYIEFTKRITDSKYSKTLNNVKVGDWVKVKMPLGSFTFTGEYPKIAFLSGGVGITPIRSIIKFIVDKKLETDTVLIYGNSREEDIIFKNDLDKMQKEYKNVKVCYTLTSPEVQRHSWCGKIGFITSEMAKEEIPDYEERVFYLCGPPKMVECLFNMLKNELKINEDKIKFENFAGYDKKSDETYRSYCV